MLRGRRNRGAAHLDSAGWVLSEYTRASGPAPRYLVRAGHRRVRDSPGLGFCACPGGRAGFPLPGGRRRAGDVGVGGGICRRHRAWAGSGGADSGAAGAPGQTVATAAAPGLEEDDEERRKRRGGKLLRGAGFRVRGRLRSLRADLSKCRGAPPGPLPPGFAGAAGGASPDRGPGRGGLRARRRRPDEAPSAASPTTGKLRRAARRRPPGAVPARGPVPDLRMLRRGYFQ